MKKKIMLFGLAAVVIIAVIYFFFIKRENKESKFTFGELKIGKISNTITSTGTLDALKTIDVGTQVSGKIDKIFVDYNSNVKKGQLLAILDTTNLALTVRDAKSNLEKAKAQYEQASSQFNRDKQLYEKNFISDLDYTSSKTNLETTLSDYHSSQNSLERAKTNLGYAYIYSPINGKIINKSVEEGQTVAASLSSPTLFQIAENLSRMQILASVDESDIGQIKLEQEAKFSVQAYPEKEFTGQVVQIRLNPETIQNVVNYTVVINADNNSNLLLPGMTATIDFYVEQKNDVLMVPNAALRFQPTGEILTAYNGNATDTKDAQAIILMDSLKSKFRNMQVKNSGQSFGRDQDAEKVNSRSFGHIWYLDNSGRLKMSRAILGLTDGKNTEIIRSRDLKDGMKIITGVENTNTSQNSNVQNQNFPRGFRRF